jgi:hypothetical protein
VPGGAPLPNGQMRRRHIVPGSVKILGLPNTSSNFGIRDNGNGQMWSETKYVGKINYWTGDVVLKQEYVPKARMFGGLLSLLGVRNPEEEVSMEFECEFKVSLLDLRPVQQLETKGLTLTGDLSMNGTRRKR